MIDQSETVIDLKFAKTRNFQDFLRKASTKFISVETSLLGSTIEEVLEYTTKFYSLHRSYIFLLSEQEPEFDLAYEYCESGFAKYENYSTKLRIKEHEKFIVSLQKGEHSINHEDEVKKRKKGEEDLNVLKRMRGMQVRSVINVPIIVGEELLGVLGFHDCKQTNEWSDDEIDNFKSIGEVLGNAIYRLQGEKRLKQTELKFQAISEISPVGIFQTDIRGRAIYVNPRWTEMSGLTPKESLGDKWTKALFPEDREIVTSNWLRFVKKPSVPFEMEFRFIKPDKKIIWLLAQAQPEYMLSGALKGYIGTLTNITAMKKIQKDREILLNELKMKNEELQRFTYTVSHDLKSPLITIKGFLGILKEDIENRLDDAVNEDLQHINKAADQMGELLKGILHVSKTQQTSLKLGEVDSLKLIKEAIGLLKGQMLNKEIEIDIEGEFPVLLLDKLKMLEVFQNLLDNAIKYMGEQEKPKINIGYRKYGNEHLFQITDNGMGIEDRFKDKVFELFDRLDKSIEGSGIGLTIVKRIILQHNGRIWIESSGANQGSTFFFTIPNNFENVIDNENQPV